MKRLCLILLSFALWTAANAHALGADGINPQRTKLADGVTYTIFPQGDYAIDFEVSRPDKKDTKVVLSIPAAFTTHDIKIDGVYVVDGVAGNENSVNKDIGGAIIFQKGECRMMATDKGEMLSKDFIRQIQQTKGSLFQQFLIVNAGKPASFKDKTKFQRRAIVRFNDGKLAIIESDKSIDFNTFNTDLVKLGARQAIYTDMGAWDEGWYRDAATGKIVIIGKDRSLTWKQSNWVVFRK